jgi:hypothetical protein
MLTYQVRPRVLRITDDQKLEFPAEVEVSLYFQPLQPFGKAPGGGLTTVRSQPASVFFNANTGQHFVESKSPLGPLKIEIEEPTRLITLEGNRVTIKERCEDYKKFTDLLESLYFGLPLLLAVEIRRSSNRRTSRRPDWIGTVSLGVVRLASGAGYRHSRAARAEVCHSMEPFRHLKRATSQTPHCRLALFPRCLPGET